MTRAPYKHRRILSPEIPEDPVCITDRREVFPQAGLDEVILQPPVGLFDLALGVGREGIEGREAARQQDLLPWGIDLIGEPMVTDLELVPTPDEAEEGVAIDVVRVGRAGAEHQPLHGVDGIQTVSCATSLAKKR